VGEMSNRTLTPLGGARHEFAGVKIAEITDRAIVSIAIPNGGRAEVTKAIAGAFKCDLPDVGASSLSPIADIRFLGLQSDQIFAVFEPDSADPATEVGNRLKGAAYLTDQSDAWVMIRVWGKAWHATLERICPIDLHPTVFGDGMVARTVMEHLNVIILRQKEDDFLLLSPRSSAKSILHALETSARNITHTSGNQ